MCGWTKGVIPGNQEEMGAVQKLLQIVLRSTGLRLALVLGADGFAKST